MILADTSVWIDHFRYGSPRFTHELADGNIMIHSVVLGELATENLRQRHITLIDLQRLPRAREGRLDECLTFIETHRLFGRGLGWSDVQLLVAAHLSHTQIWSRDQQLAQAAGKFKLRYLSK